MTSIELNKDADGEGNIHLELPIGAPNARVRLQITYEVDERRRARTKEEYLAFIDRIFGKCDDPTFQPFGDQLVESIEPL